MPSVISSLQTRRKAILAVNENNPYGNWVQVKKTIRFYQNIEVSNKYTSKMLYFWQENINIGNNINYSKLVCWLISHPKVTIRIREEILQNDSCVHFKE